MSTCCSDTLRKEGASLPRRDRQAVTWLSERVEVERDTARAALGEALVSGRYLALFDRLDELVPFSRRGDQQIALPKLAGREFRKLRRAVDDLGDSPGDEALHVVRIRGKRARYVAELAEPVIGKPVSRFLRAARRFQDVLGEYQDAVVAERRLVGLVAQAPSPRVAFGMGRLTERQRARRQAALAGFPAAWRRLRRRGESVSG